jgi:hypothetical protein
MSSDLVLAVEGGYHICTRKMMASDPVRRFEALR